jgi:oxygen-independent coproporphyrinogen-3 oxidase
MLSLYVHIPFCLRKCNYCNFVITVDRSETMRHRFFSALELEIRAAQQKYGRLCFDTVYFGGGTPSALSAEETVQLFALLKQFFDFKPGAEITWEVNPGDVDQEKIGVYRGVGINRISLGIQSFQEASLKDMARPHGSAEVYETMRLLRAHEFQNISVDLILRLPGESLDIMRQNIQAALALEPAQFTLYDLEVNAGTVYGARAERGVWTILAGCFCEAWL